MFRMGAVLDGMKIDHAEQICRVVMTDSMVSDSNMTTPLDNLLANFLQPASRGSYLCG